MMTHLLAWRNPQGREETWMRSHQEIPSRGKHIAKTLTTEIGLCLLTATAAVETVVYGALSVATLILYPITDRPCDCSLA